LDGAAAQERPEKLILKLQVSDSGKEMFKKSNGRFWQFLTSTDSFYSVVHENSFQGQVGTGTTLPSNSIF